MPGDASRLAVGDRRLAVLRLLADARFHSGEQLAAMLGVSRATVWKHVRGLSHTCGVEVAAVRGRGYRLAEPIELFDREQLVSLLAQDTTAHLARLDLVETVGSTNTYLLGRRLADSDRGIACLAERQTAGRGRRGRFWVSPFGANIYLSVLWRFDSPPMDLAGLSLAAGVAIAQALAGVGVAGVSLKWPNDLLWDSRKLAGILVELGGESDGPTHAVIGVGLNLRMPHGAGREVGQPWVDLGEVMGDASPARNLLAARLIDGLVAMCLRFRAAGLAPFLGDWQALDCLAGRPVRVVLGDRVVDGVGLGIAPNGALRVRTVDGECELHAGEASLRLRDAT